MLAQGAKTSVPPLLHAVAERLQGYLSQALQRVRSAGGNVGGLEEVSPHFSSHLSTVREGMDAAMHINRPVVHRKRAGGNVCWRQCLRVAVWEG
jgi:hypothetical protein